MSESIFRVGFFSRIKILVYFSIFAIILDGIVGIDTFITATERLGFLLNIVWAAKVAISVWCIVSLGFYPPGFFEKVMYFLGVVNMVRGVFTATDIGALLASVFFYVIIFLGATVGKTWAIQEVKGAGKVYISSTHAMAFVYGLSGLCLLYFLLYVTGKIEYFGFGVQIYIVTAVAMSQSMYGINLYLLLVATLLTGKRGLFIMYIAQTWSIVGALLKRNKLVFVVTTVIAGALIYFIGTSSGFFDRFAAVADLSVDDIKHITDEDVFNKFYLATSGRSSEIYGFISTVDVSDASFWIGYPAGYIFPLFELTTGDTIEHHYFHISPFNYLKHFGLPVSLILLWRQILAAKFAMKYGLSSRCFGLILYLGYFCAMFFGAVVVIDILFWVSYGYAMALYERKAIPDPLSLPTQMPSVRVRN